MQPSLQEVFRLIGDPKVCIGATGGMSRQIGPAIETGTLTPKVVEYIEDFLRRDKEDHRNFSFLPMDMSSLIK